MGGKRYELEEAFEDLIDRALNELSVDDFERFKDAVREILDNYNK